MRELPMPMQGGDLASLESFQGGLGVRSWSQTSTSHSVFCWFQVPRDHDLPYLEGPVWMGCE